MTTVRLYNTGLSIYLEFQVSSVEENISKEYLVNISVPKTSGDPSRLMYDLRMVERAWDVTGHLDRHSTKTSGWATSDSVDAGIARNALIQLSMSPGPHKFVYGIAADGFSAADYGFTSWEVAIFIQKIKVTEPALGGVDEDTVSSGSQSVRIPDSYMVQITIIRGDQVTEGGGGGSP